MTKANKKECLENVLKEEKKGAKFLFHDADKTKRQLQHKLYLQRKQQNKPLIKKIWQFCVYYGLYFIVFGMKKFAKYSNRKSKKYSKHT